MQSSNLVNLEQEIIKLYKKTCGKMHPLPEDPEHLTREMLTEAF